MVHNPAYLYNRSLEYLDGIGVAQDDVRAFHLCEKAAGAGLHDAVLAMGWHYLNGAGVEKDVEQAQWWYKKSAKQREPRAMFSPAQIANSTANYESAMTWFQRASDLGHVRSLYWMARLYRCTLTKRLSYR